MAAFQPYAGAYCDDRESYGWSCYATCRVYEVRAFDDALPEPPKGRKWVWKPQSASGGPHFAVLVDDGATDFSQILAQVTRRSARVDA